MKIKVNYMSQIRKATGVGEETIEVNEVCTVQDMIKKNLCVRHAGLGQYILEENGALRSIILIFHGDTKVVDNIPRDLKEGDTLTIMAPITGG